MLKFTANLSLLFTELPMLERFQAAKDAGFDNVEIQFPYEHSAEDFNQAAKIAGTDIVLINVPVGDLMQGGAGLACVPGKEQEFQHALELCLDVADVLKPRCINVLAGRCLDETQRQQHIDTFYSNLYLSCEHMSKHGFKTVFEAVNTFDMTGFLIHNCQQMQETLSAVNHPNLSMQFDVYHMSRMSEDVCERILALGNNIGHIQIADNPGRGEPGSGAINYSAVFEAIEESLFQGFTGAEYFPTSKDTKDSLVWFNNFEDYSR